MQKIFIVIACLLAVSVKGQNYGLQVLSSQPYTEISQADYEIPDTSVYFNNVNTKPDMYFNAFGSLYDLYESVYIPLKQGYAYFFNNSRSTTLYVAKGIFGARPGAGQTSVFSFKTTGSGATANLTLQWKNMGFQNGDQNDFINFQLKLYGSTGIIEYCFGSNSVKPGLWEDGANGPTIGLLNMDDQFSTIYKQLSLSGNSANPSLSFSHSVVNLLDVPASGTVYRFTPSVTGIGETSSIRQAAVFPNPAANYLHIHTDKQQNSWRVFDMLGALKAEGYNIPVSGIDISHLSPGTYVVQLMDEAGVSSNTRFVKK